jgi:hypothetical protein
MTTGFEAGLQTNAVELSYGAEATWGTLPAVAFQAVRLTGGDRFAGSKQRQRPNEIRTDYQASAAITTQEEAAAGFDGALSFSTYDDLLEGLLMDDFSTAVAISATDIAATATGFSSTTTNLSTNVSTGQWIKVAGFANTNLNTFYRVTAVTSTSITTATAPAATEAAGASVSMTGSMLRNGTSFKSFYFQKKLAADKFLLYPGTYFTQGSISAQVGQFVTLSLTGAAKNEAKATSNQSTGSVVAAPTGRVHDTVGNLTTPTLDGAALSAAVTGLDLQFTKEQAGPEYGLGSASAQGMLQGGLTVSGTLRMFFKDFTEYDLFAAESDHLISYRTADAAGNAYILTLLAATIMNPSITAQGPNQSLMAEFTLEGNPSTTYGKTVQIDKFAA